LKDSLDSSIKSFSPPTKSPALMEYNGHIKVDDEQKNYFNDENFDIDSI